MKVWGDIIMDSLFDLYQLSQIRGVHGFHGFFTFEIVLDLLTLVNKRKKYLSQLKSTNQ
jgi:hypothetical protein